MKNAVFATARNEEQARKVVDHLRTSLNISSQEISVLLPQQSQQHAQAGQQPKKTNNPNDKTHGQPNQPHQQHGQPNQPHQQHGQPNQPTKSNFPNANISLKSLNLPENETRKIEDSLKHGQVFIAVQTDSNDKLEKAQEYFKKEGLSNISTNREKAKSWQ